MFRFAVFGYLFTLAAATVLAQGGHHGKTPSTGDGTGHGVGHGTPGPHPYAGMEQRSVKALSAEQTADLAAGRGMGLALAAELNGYPGPMHVLELAEPLALTPTQHAQVARLFEDMRRDAIAAGKEVVAAEAALDRLFAEGVANPAGLASAVMGVAHAQAELRRVHLSFHLVTHDLLTAEQRGTYARLRGYRH
jgi:Spy/CpxP family protein refolding chaperone